MKPGRGTVPRKPLEESVTWYGPVVMNSSRPTDAEEAMSGFFELSAKERDQLEHLLTLRCDSRKYQRALTLLSLNNGLSAEEVSTQLHVSRQSVYNWADHFERRRPLSTAQRVSDARRSGRPATVSRVIDPLIDAVIDSDPRESGYNSTVWTADLLCAYLHDRHNQQAIRRSIGYALSRLDIRWKRPRHTLSRRDPYWRQAKGG